MARTFDPITPRSVRRLISIVDEADGSVARTAFSSLLRDAHDYTCMFTDRFGGSSRRGPSRHRAIGRDGSRYKEPCQ
jgi:N-methylhydantoinase B